MTTDLAGRVQALESATAIRELPARYADCYAHLDLAALASLYVADVPLHNGDVGRDALQRHFEMATRGKQPGAGLHSVILQCGGHVIDFDGPESAHGVVYCHAEVQRMNGSRYQQAIVYTDTYARRDGRWYFARQRQHELLYGVGPMARPNGLPDAHWPASQIGRGTLPAAWPSWSAFWAGNDGR